MSEFFKAELKDKFLQYALERDDYFEVQLLYDEFLRPGYNIQFVEKLVLEIIDYDADLLDVMSGNGSKLFMLSATAYTNRFLEDSNFKDLYIQEEEKWDVFLNQLSNTQKLSFEEKVALGKTEKQSPKKERKLLFTLIAAVIFSFIFSIFSIGKALFGHDSNVTQKQLEQELETMRRALESKQGELENRLIPIESYIKKKDSTNAE